MAAPLLLASRSPRRAQLLREAGIPFEHGPFPDVDETLPPGLGPDEAARRLAEEKVRAVLPGAAERTVLAADTIVVLDGEVLGKPQDASHARRMLARLAGRAHRVVTGVAVARGVRLESGTASSRVRFRGLDAAEIRAYVATGEPLDKAGAYGIQGGAADFVVDVDGALDTVIGLPLDLVRALLGRLGTGA